MSIKGKLLFMVYGIIGVFSLVTVYAFISYLSLTRITDEKIKLRELSEITLLLRGDINRTTIAPLSNQYAEIIKSKTQFDKIFLGIEALEYLLDLDSDTAEALQSIRGLQILFLTVWDNFENSFKLVISDAEQILHSNNITLNDFIDSSPVQKHNNKDQILSRLDDLNSAIFIAERNLYSAYNVMRDQFIKIDKEIDVKEFRMFISVSVTVAIIFFFTLGISIWITKNISNSFLALEKGLIKIQKGDLTTEFEIKTKDEIGRLGQSMNLFTSELAESIRQFKFSSRSNIEIKEELQVTTIQTSSAAHQISVNISGIKSKIDGLDKSIQDSTRDVGTVKKGIEDLNNMIQEQISMVEESTAAVTEMIASISSVNDIAARKREATKVLVNTSQEGGEKLTQTTELIQEITSNIDEIKGIAGIIQNVAAQTSLLSMNAAIEAAHAGSYGRGFSVVADEIRKLAEASGKNSSRISQVLKEVVGKIESASTSGYETRKAFDNIDSEVAGVSSSFDEITASMNELNTGSQQILQTMTSLQDYSVQVQEGSSNMNESSDHLKEAFGVVERVSQEVLGSISEVNAGIDEISTEMNTLTDMSDSLSDIAENLDSEINRFQTDKNLN